MLACIENYGVVNLFTCYEGLFENILEVGDPNYPLDFKWAFASSVFFRKASYCYIVLLELKA